MPMTDRRRHPRAVVRGLRTWILLDDGYRARCRIVDVSRRGVLIEASQLLLPGATIQLVFARTQGPNVTKVFRRWAQVVRSSPSAVAVNFVHGPQRRAVAGLRR
ncbi:MAG: PilZ domain-containing protein [Gammaproteobacteria bacterium]|nr:PilZ domain-containing protein [Gammaproteobacteria bacterium]